MEGKPKKPKTTNKFNGSYDLEVASDWRERVRQELRPKTVRIGSIEGFRYEIGPRKARTGARRAHHAGSASARGSLGSSAQLEVGLADLPIRGSYSDTSTSSSESVSDDHPEMIDQMDQMRDSVFSLRRFHELSAEAHKSASKRCSKKSKMFSKFIVFVGFVSLCLEGAFRLWGNDDQENIAGVIGVVLVAALSEINRSRGYFKKKHEHLRVRDEHLRAITPIDFAFKFERSHPEQPYDYSTLLLDLDENQSIISHIGRKIPKKVLKLPQFEELKNWTPRASVKVEGKFADGNRLVEQESFEDV